jgi:phage nucleotide-binding protein
MLEIKTAKDIHSDGVKMLIYSPPGIGKTTLATTLDLKNTLVVSFEAGLLSVLDEESGQDVQYVEPKNIAELFELYKHLDTEESRKKFDNIFIDSLSEISEMIMHEIKSNPDEYSGMQDNLKAYMIAQERTLLLAKRFRDLKGYNIFMTALEDTVVVQMREVSVPSLVGKKLGKKLTSIPDFVVHLEVDDEGQRVLRTQPTKDVVAKSRSRKLQALEVANLNTIVQKLQEK